MIDSSLLDDLIKNTSFEIMTDSRILTSRKKIRTPLEVLNCLLGGGFPTGIIAHIYGEPKAGKSTLFYQTMGIFQQEYPDGISIIVDMESSADPARLKALGVDVNRVIRLPATSIENGFISLRNLIKNLEGVPELKDVPIFAIWDTISKGMPTDTTIQSRMLAQDRARIIKGYMGELQKSIEQHDFFLGLINQIIYTTDRYGNRKVEAGGGVALKHDNQLSLFVKMCGDQFDDYGILVRRDSEIQIDKSKISPEIKGIKCSMDVTKGALIDEKQSFLSYIYWMGIIDQGKGGWYQHRTMYNNSLVDDFSRFIIDRPGLDLDKKQRWASFEEDLKNNDMIMKLFSHLFMTMIENKFTLQKEVMKDYHNQILEEIKFIGLDKGSFTSEEFDKYAYGIVPESENDSEEESNLIEE